jgi:hypothetical protein
MGRQHEEMLVGAGAVPILLVLIATGVPAQDGPSNPYAALLESPPVQAIDGRSELVHLDAEGELIYGRDEDGNRLADFSYAGYRGGGVAIPDVAVAEVLDPQPDADDTHRIQAAIDRVGRTPLGPDGVRGAVLLRAGRYDVSSTLHFREDGVVLRGEGAGFGGTWIYHHRMDVVPDPTPCDYIHYPRPEKGILPTLQTHAPAVETEQVSAITSELVAVGDDRVTVEDVGDLEVGDEVVVVCRQTPKWLAALGLEEEWGGRPFELRFQRVVREIEPDTGAIVLDIPLTSRIDTVGGYAEAELHRVVRDGRLRNIGVEDILFLSGYDRSITGEGGYFTDEHHPNYVFRFYGARDGWMRRCVAFFYSCGMVATGGSQHLTIEDCAMLDGVSTDTPVSHAGTRKYYFNANGDHILLQRCYGRYARHAFIGNGPYEGCVFLDCVSERDHLPNEWHQRWGHSYLYDNLLTDAPLSIIGVDNHGHGQKSAFAVLWNCVVDNQRVWESDVRINKLSPLFQNYAMGVMHWGSGESGLGEHDHAIGSVGWIESPMRPVTPRSLYLAQLEQRLGPGAVRAVATAEQVAEARGPAWQLMLDEFSGLPVWPDPDEAPWPGYENRVAVFDPPPSGVTP